MERDERLLTEVAAAEALGLAVSTLQAWRQRDSGPPYVRLGRAVRYKAPDIASWLVHRTVRPSGAFREQAVDCLVEELRLAPDGRPSPSVLLRFLDKLGPRDATRIAWALASMPLDRRRRGDDGSVVLEIMAHVDVVGVRPGSHVEIVFYPETGEWVSALAAPWAPGLLGLTRHVLNLRVPRAKRDAAALSLLAMLGACHLKAIDNAAPPLAPPLDALAEVAR